MQEVKHVVGDEGGGGEGSEVGEAVRVRHYVHVQPHLRQEEKLGPEHNGRRTPRAA